MTRRKKILNIVWAFIALAVLLLFHFKERNSYICSECFSGRNQFQWRIGIWKGIDLPLSSQWEQVNDSVIFQDFFTDEHAHNWVFAQGSPYYFFGTKWGGCALGIGRHRNEFVQAYEGDPEYRQLITEMIENGKLSPEIIEWFLEIPAFYDEDSFDKEEMRKINVFYDTLEANRN